MLFLLLSLCHVTLQYQPIVGIVAFPSEFANRDKSKFLQVPKSYASWLESAGAQVIPIPYNLPVGKMQERLRLVNAVVIPGGFHGIYDDNKKTPSQVTKQIQLLIQSLSNDMKPIFMIHNGANIYEAIIDSQYPTRQVDVFRYFKAEDLNANIRFTFNHSSEMWSFINPDVLDEMALENNTYYYHNSSLSVEAFIDNDYLRNNFIITAQSLDRLGWWFVAAMQHKTLPIYTTQFFPNAPQFEFDSSLHIPRSKTATDFCFGLAYLIVDQASKTPMVTADISQLKLSQYEPTENHRGVHGDIYFIPQ